MHPPARAAGRLREFGPGAGAEQSRDDGEAVLHAVADFMDQQLLQLLALVLLGDIGVGPEPARHPACGIPDRHGARQEPPVLPVRAAQRECVLPRLARVPGALDARDGSAHMIGVMNLAPAPALHLLQRRAGVFVPTPVVPVDPALCVGHPGELRQGIRHAAELRLTLARRPPHAWHRRCLCRRRSPSPPDPRRPGAPRSGA